MKTLPYEAIIFDLDGTLRVSSPRFMDALFDTLKEMGYPIRREAWKHAEPWVHYYWARSPELQLDLETHGDGQLWLRFIHRLLQEGGLDASLEDAQAVIDAFSEAYHPTSVLMPGAKDTLNALREKDVTLGILSNRREPFQEELQHLGIADYFDFTLAAGEVGVWKPDPNVFFAALERAGNVSPERAVYVGDNYYADVKGAKAAGMDVILMNDRGIFEVDEVPTITELRQLLSLLNI